MYDSLVAARPSATSTSSRFLFFFLFFFYRHLLHQHSLTRLSPCCYTKARDRSNVVYPAVNTQHGGFVFESYSRGFFFKI